MRRDYRFMTPYEKEWDRAFALAMSAMRDPRTDEAQMLGEAMTDQIYDLLELAALAVSDEPDSDLGYRFKNFVRTLAQGVAEAEAERACETVPQERAA